MPDGSPAAMARALEATERFETAATSPYARLHADLKASIGPSQRGSASWAMLSPLLRSAEMLAQTEAVCRLARIALAAAERRAKSGKLPASLDELKDAFPEGVPVDPFTDAPFVYEATETGVRISTSGHLPGESAPEGRRAPEAGFTWELKR
jgi:hypothetical protein